MLGGSTAKWAQASIRILLGITEVTARWKTYRKSTTLNRIRDIISLQKGSLKTISLKRNP